MGETVYRVTREETGVDRYNKPVFTDTDVQVDGVGVAPTSQSVDPETGAVVASRGMTLYLPPDVVSASDDRWRVRDITYETDGASADWSSIFEDWHPGNVVVLKEAEFIDGQNESSDQP